MKPEREGIIWALLTDEERAEMPTPESRQWYGDGKWNDDEENGTAGSMAYRPRPKPASAWQDEFEEWRRDKVLFTSLEPGEALLTATVEAKKAAPVYCFDRLGDLILVPVLKHWSEYIHEAEEFVEPYTQDSLPWPLVVKKNTIYSQVAASYEESVVMHLIGNITYSELAKLKTPSGEPCGIRKWRKKS